jgi:outer membrane protein assembly factor BamE (lipoprotein component of BamABCDE complex)
MPGSTTVALPSGHLITTTVAGQQQIIQIPPGMTAEQLRQHLPGKTVRNDRTGSDMK